MSLTVWDTLRNFTPKENWGDPSKINPALLIILDSIRSLVGCPIIINNAYSDGAGHIKGSQHYLGNAVDFHFGALTLQEQDERLRAALNSLGYANKVGLGIYPDWHTPGFHLDVRGEKARWSRIDGVYLAYDHIKVFT